MNLVKSISLILHKLDPMHLQSPHEDEYHPEAKDILHKMQSTNSEYELEVSIKEIFKYWFSLPESKSNCIDYKLIVKTILDNKNLKDQFGKLV